MNVNDETENFEKSSILIDFVVLHPQMISVNTLKYLTIGSILITIGTAKTIISMIVSLTHNYYLTTVFTMYMAKHIIR